MEIKGIHHLGLAVCNLQATRDFFVKGLGWEVVKHLPDYPAYFVSNGAVFLTLWQTKPGCAEFDRHRNVGLHHFALRVASEEVLAGLFERLKQYPGVDLDFAPEPLGDGPAKHFMIFEPSGVRMEFIFVPES